MQKFTRRIASAVIAATLCAGAGWANAGPFDFSPVELKAGQKAAVLVTPHCVVTLTLHNTGPTEATYEGLSRASGKKIKLDGTALYTIGVHGTPGRFLGYEFRNGQTVYQVFEDGGLRITQGDTKVLIDEQGTWGDEQAK